MQVASYFVDVPEDAAFLPAAEIARKLGVSDATVIRAAQALGYSGLAELKRELIEIVRTRMNPTRQAARSLEGVGDDLAGVLDQVLDLQIASLEDARRVLSRTDFARAVDALAKASRIHVLGFGPSGVLADYMRMRLTRIGRHALAATQAGFLLAEPLLAMRKGDVLLLIAHGTYSGEVDAALDHSAQLGIPVVLLTDLLSTGLESRVTITLAARRSSAGMLRSPATTLVLLDALLLGLAVRDRSGALAHLERLQELRRSIAAHRGATENADEG